MAGGWRCSGLVAAMLAGAIAGAAAQGAPPASPAARAPDPRMAEAQAAYETLPEAERRAIQRDLGFVAAFAGAAAGGFGPLTLNAIARFQKSMAAPETGVLTPQQRQRLAQGANTIRQQWQFRVERDEKSGVSIGLPNALLPRREANTSGGQRWQSQDQRVTLDTSTLPPDQDLAAIYERAIGTNVPGRKITYKLLRPEFFVVTGETATGKFYRRLAKGSSGLRGFSLGYDKALADPWDGIAAIIANHFDPFGEQPELQLAAAPAIVPPNTVPPNATPAPVVAVRPVPPLQRERWGTAMPLATGRALTTLAAVENCRTLTLSGRPATISERDAPSGLAVLTSEGVTAPAGLSLSAGDVPDLLALAQGETAPGTRGLTVAPATPAGASVQGALQPGGAGALVFDNGGGLVGLVNADPGQRIRVAGIVPAARWALTPREGLARMLAKYNVALAPPATQARSTGWVAGQRGRLVLPLLCQL